MLDTDIDLTIENKFRYREPKPIYRSDDAMYKIRKSGEEVHFSFCSLVKRSSQLPWNCREVNSSNDLSSYRVQRSYGDPLSDEYGSTLRITSQNNIWIIKDDTREYYPEVLEEFLMETIGGYPYIAINTCFKCGKKFIQPYKSRWRYSLCPQCERRKKVPWNGGGF